MNAPRKKKRRKKKRKAKERARRAGLGAVLGHLCVALALPWVVGPGESDDIAGMAIFCVMPLLITTPFVYTGASRLAVPHLPVWISQTEHGYTSDGTSVTIHTGSKQVVINRRWAAFNLAIGLGVWIVVVSMGIYASRAGS